MIRIVMMAASLLAASAGQAKVVETGAERFVTRDTASVKTAPLATWLALIKPGEWWNSQHSWSGDAKNMTLTPQGGGCFCERIPVGDTGNSSAMEGSARHAEVLQAFPMKVLRMRGGFGPLQGEPATGVLTITLKEVPGGTRILWEYNVGGPMRYKLAEIAPAVDAVMTEQLKRLQAYLGALEDNGAEEAAAPAAAYEPKQE